MNANLELIKQEIITGSEELNSSKEVYEFKKKFLDGKTGKIVGQKGKAYLVALKDGNKAKELIVRPDHLKLQN